MAKAGKTRAARARFVAQSRLEVVAGRKRFLTAPAFVIRGVTNARDPRAFPNRVACENGEASGTFSDDQSVQKCARAVCAFACMYRLQKAE